MSMDGSKKSGKEALKQAEVRRKRAKTMGESGISAFLEKTTAEFVDYMSGLPSSTAIYDFLEEFKAGLQLYPNKDTGDDMPIQLLCSLITIYDGLLKLNEKKACVEAALQRKLEKAKDKLKLEKEKSWRKLEKAQRKLEKAKDKLKIEKKKKIAERENN